MFCYRLFWHHEFLNLCNFIYQTKDLYTNRYILYFESDKKYLFSDLKFHNIDKNHPVVNIVLEFIIFLNLKIS